MLCADPSTTGTRLPSPVRGGVWPLPNIPELSVALVSSNILFCVNDSLGLKVSPHQQRHTDPMRKKYNWLCTSYLILPADDTAGRERPHDVSWERKENFFFFFFFFSRNPTEQVLKFDSKETAKRKCQSNQEEQTNFSLSLIQLLHFFEIDLR